MTYVSISLAWLLDENIPGARTAEPCARARAKCMIVDVCIWIQIRLSIWVCDKNRARSLWKSYQHDRHVHAGTDLSPVDGTCWANVGNHNPLWTTLEIKLFLITCSYLSKSCAYYGLPFFIYMFDIYCKSDFSGRPSFFLIGHICTLPSY